MWEVRLAFLSIVCAFTGAFKVQRKRRAEVPFGADPQNELALFIKQEPGVKIGKAFRVRSAWQQRSEVDLVF